MSSRSTPSQTGIDATRELSRPSYRRRPPLPRYIIDEAHGLSKQAVDAFLKTLESCRRTPSSSSRRRQLTSQRDHPPRCQRFDFRSVPRHRRGRARRDRPPRGDGIRRGRPRAIARGRRKLPRRDPCSIRSSRSPGKIDAASVEAALGLPHARAVRDLVDAILARDAGRSPSSAVSQQGTDLVRFATMLGRLGICGARRGGFWDAFKPLLARARLR
jgi:hypothetical protein